MSTHAPDRPALLRSATVVAAAAMALALAACNRNDDRTAGQKLDSAIATTEQAAQEAKVRTQQAAQEAKVVIQEAAQETRAKAEAAAHDAQARSGELSQEARTRMQEAGQAAKADTHAVQANARAAVEDAGITARVNAGLARDPGLSAVRIDVDTRDGVVTLAGPARTAQDRERATQIAQKVDGVVRVINNLTLAPAS